MYPILFSWGPIVLPAWHVFLMIAAIIGYRALLWLNERSGTDFSPKILGEAFAIAYVGGYFGSRLLNMIVEQESYDGFGGFLSQLFSLGGMVFYGGAIVGGLLASAFFILRRLHFGRCLDISVPPAFLGLAIGRIGCFLNGDDFGKALALHDSSMPWWAVVFPNLQDGLPRYPVQLMESFTALVLFLVPSFALIFGKRDWPAGVIGSLGISSYGLCRFFLEEFRGDERGWIFDPRLSTSQFLSIIFIGLGVLMTLAYVYQARVSAKFQE